MKSIVWLLLILSLSSAFNEPWKNQTWLYSNPHIWHFGFDYWWNMPALDKTLTSINIEELNKLPVNGSINSSLIQAAQNIEKAKKDRNDCELGLFGSLITQFKPEVSFFAAFYAIPSCLDYKDRWVNSVYYSLASLEQSTIKAQESIERARQEYLTIKFMGLCNISENCAELQDAFDSVDYKLSEHKYGKYPTVVNYSNQIEYNLFAPVPDLSLFSSSMKLIWDKGGIISSFNSAYDLALSTQIQAEKDFITITKSAEGRKSLATLALKKIDDEKLSLITTSPKSSFSHDATSISERFATLQKDLAKMNYYLDDGKLERGRTNKQDYLANAIGLVSEADNGYEEISSKIPELESNALMVVDQKKQEADGEISETKNYLNSKTSTGSVSLYEQAKKAFDEGESENIQGYKFVSFSKAAALSRAARIAPNYQDDSKLSASLASLSDLINRAEKDQINVITEKESLDILKSISSYSVVNYLNDLTKNLISKARSKYESDLLTARKRVYEKLSLAGPGAADLYTDVANYEKGLFDGDALIFPDSIGSLKKLQSDYAATEKTLDSYMAEIVGNSLSTKASPLIGNVILDEPAEIKLDVVLSNPYQYNATKPSVKISTIEIPFLYSDITSGKEHIQSVRSASDGLIIIFDQVRGFETKRVIFEKTTIIAHTKKNESKVTGIGYGSAQFSSTTTFSLDIDIPSLYLPDGDQGVLIDGLAPHHSLSAGVHTLSIDKIVDGYEEREQNHHVYPLGTNSKVEYDIVITPKLDLETVPLFIQIQNDSRISSFGIVAVTGEMIKEKNTLSDTVFTAKVSSLKKDRPTTIRVSYLVENTKSLVDDQIVQFNSINLSAEGKQLLEQAKIQAVTGNYTKALELLEKTRSLSTSEEQQASKTDTKYQALNKKLESELAALDLALNSTSLSDPFIEKLKSREKELQKLSGEIEPLNTTAKTEMLDKVDWTWASDQVNIMKKQVYKDYNDLKERFYLSGNSSTPESFTLFESTLNTLESGGRLEYAIKTLEALEKVRETVLQAEVENQNGKNQMQSILDDLQSHVTKISDHYSKQASIAKGTAYSSTFTEIDKTPTLFKEAKDSISKDKRLFWVKIDVINQSAIKMQGILDSLEEDAAIKISLIEPLIKEDQKEKLAAIKDMMKNGDYVNALRAASALSKEFDSKKDDNTMIILGITAFAIMGGIAFHIFTQKPVKKELRKLPSMKEEPLEDFPRK